MAQSVEEQYQTTSTFLRQNEHFRKSKKVVEHSQKHDQLCIISIEVKNSMFIVNICRLNKKKKESRTNWNFAAHVNLHSTESRSKSKHHHVFAVSAE